MKAQLIISSHPSKTHFEDGKKYHSQYWEMYELNSDNEPINKITETLDTDTFTNETDTINHAKQYATAHNIDIVDIGISY